MATSNVIGIPEHEGDFERHCRVLFAEIINDSNLKLVATRGKNQGGFDLIGTRNGDPEQTVGIQCKNKPKGGKLVLADVRSDIARMLQFEPPVTEIYVVTTASDDHSYDKLAIELRKAQKDLGRSVDIQIWGWDTLTARILSSPAALAAFDPDRSASTGTLLAHSAETLSLQHESLEIQREMQTAVTELLASRQALDPVEASSRADIDEVLHKQIDDIRDLLNTGRPKTALDLLEKLAANSSSQSVAIRARIKANMGHAIMRLGDERRGGEFLLEAYALNPDDAKLKANRILGLVLTDHAREAVDFARSLFNAGEGDETVASFLYQAAAVLDEDMAPDDIVGGQFSSDENVAIGRAVYLRKHRGAFEWRDYANTVAAEHSGSQILLRLSAEATLDEIYERRSFGPGDANKEDREAMERAVVMLHAIWESAKSQEDAGQQQVISIAANLVTAYRALRNPKAADEVGKQALALAPNDEALLLATSHIDIISDRAEAAVEKLLGLPESRQRTTALLGAYASLGQWSDVAEFATTERRQALDGLDMQAFDCIALDARFRVGKVIDERSALGDLVAAWPEELHVAASAADIARQYYPEMFDELFDRAMALAQKPAPISERMVLAELALRSDRYDAAVEVLNGHVDLNEPSEPLGWLAMAFVNSTAASDAHAFFDSLPETVLDSPRFSRMAGTAEYNRGDLASAEKHLKRALQVDPDDLRSTLMLEGTLIREGRDDDAIAFIQTVDETKSRGSPLEKMRLAVSLRRAGEASRAFGLAFDVASRNRDNEAVASAFPQLLFMSEASLPGADILNGIQDGFWFRLEGQGTADIEGLLSNDAIPGAHCHSADQVLGKALLGKNIGDEVVLPERLGIERRYVVREIKHRWIWLAHDIMHSHAARFPDSASMVQMTMQDNDVQPILDIVRKGEQDVLDIVDTYRASPLPLAFIAALRSGDVVGFAHRVTASGGDIKTCVGLLEERRLAQEYVSRARNRGAVFDTYTLVMAEAFELLPPLREYFGRLLISRDTMDDFTEWRQRQSLNVGRETMALSYEGEQAVKHVQSVDDNSRQLEILDRLIANVRNHCEIMPLEGGTEPEAARMQQAGLDDLLEPIRIARSKDVLLLSDDLHFRQLAQQMGVRRSAWLQAVGLDLLGQRSMSRHEYALLVARLANRRHHFLSLDTDTLLELLDLENDEDDLTFNLVARNIGGPQAHLQTHANVFMEFAARVWNCRMPSWRKGRAIGRLLENLLNGRGSQTNELLDAIEKLLSSRRSTLDQHYDLALDYVQGWRRGHFLSASTRREAVAKSGKKKRQRSRPNE